MKIFTLLLIILFISCKGPTKETEPAKPYDTSYRDSTYLEELKSYRATISKETFESHLSNWDGSLPSLVQFTKENLNDPKSFEHVETGYIIRGDYVEVQMIYRARNGFNALIKSSITAKADGKGNLIEIVDSQ